MRIAQYEQYGPADVIQIVEKDVPVVVGDNDVCVDVIAVGINPADTKMRRGRLPIQSFPAGIGREFSGVVCDVGKNVDHVVIGQAVIGTGEGVLRDQVVVDKDSVMPMPEGITWDQAAVLPVAAQTAWKAVESQNVQPGEICVVSSAVGGVGHVICQLLVAKGATVIGSASEWNHEYLEEALGVIPITYGEGFAKRLEEATPQGIHHVFDQSGSEMIEAALELGVPREYINSVSGMGPHYGVPTVGRVGLDPEAINALAQMLAVGDLAIPIKVFPMDEARKGFIHMEEVHDKGKVVIRLDSDPEEEFRAIREAFGGQ